MEQYARAGKPEPLFAHHILWGGPPEGLLTWFLQRTIIGIEAYLPSALFIAAVNYRRVREAIFRAKNDPFDVDAKRTTTADRLYNKLPGLLHQNYQLNRVNGALWKSVREFYDAVRNPLFHGYQLDTAGRRHLDTLDAVLRAYDMFIQIYQWIDWWCPQRFVMGENMGGVLPVSEMPMLPDGHPCAASNGKA